MHSSDVIPYLVSLTFFLNCYMSFKCPSNILAPAPVQREQPQFVDPCLPSPCGPNSQCRAVGDSPSCSCLLTYIGAPPNCRPECVINADCPSTQACINEKCRDPCPGACGFAALCSVIRHAANCQCPPGYTGNPFSYCQPEPPPKSKLISIFIRASK